MKTTDNQFSSKFRTAAMCLLLASVVGGCASNPPPRPVPQPQPSRLELAPSQFGPGPAKIVSANPELRFVVIDFSSRVMPPIGTRLDVYRGEKNIGAVQITEPVRARLATADIVEGDVRVGDEAR